MSEWFKKSGLKRVVVKFSGNEKEYTFLTDLDVKQYERVVVDTQYGVQIAQVVKDPSEVSVEEAGKASRWAFQKVDEDRLAFLKGRELMRQKLIQTLDLKLKERSILERYSALAKEDSEAADILKRLREMEG